MRKIFKNKALITIFNYLLNIISGILVAISITVFVSPNKFVSTGFSGISLVIGRLFDKINHSFNPEAKYYEKDIISVLYFILNIPLLILAWKKFSKKYAILTLVNIISTSIAVALIPNGLNETLNLSVEKGNITMLDAAVFSGALTGFSSALAFYVGGSAGGVDTISTYYSISKQSTNGKIAAIINACILVAGVIVNGSTDALRLSCYTIVYIILSAIVIDLFYSRNKKVILMIITSKGDEVSNIINHTFVRGVTKMDAVGTYTSTHKDFLYCACSLFETKTIIDEIKKIDEHAFVTIVEAHKVFGNFIVKDIRK